MGKYETFEKKKKKKGSQWRLTWNAPSDGIEK